MENISIMMVTYNRLDFTKQTIENIYNTVKTDFNFIIVDNGSTDGTVNYIEGLKQDKSNIFTHYYDKNMGIGKGRNKALKIAVNMDTDWFATVDNDIILPNNWLSECISVLKDATEYGIIGVNFEKPQFEWVTVNGHLIQYNQFGIIPTCCSVFGRKLRDSLGYFDDYDALYGVEDSDWSHRAKVLGYKLGYIKECGKYQQPMHEEPKEYRQFKDNCREQCISQYYKNCELYSLGEKPVYVEYKED